MTLLTQDVMVQANIDVNRMSAQQKVQLTDEIYVQQPNLLASILVLPRYGVDMQLLEEPIHVLLVAFQAMKHCGHALPTISEDVQETCLQRLTATLKFSEGVPPDLVEQMITKFCVDHPERYLLAFVYGHLGQHDLLRVRTDAEKYLLLACQVAKKTCICGSLKTHLAHIISAVRCQNVPCPCQCSATAAAWCPA